MRSLVLKPRPKLPSNAGTTGLRNGTARGQKNRPVGALGLRRSLRILPIARFAPEFNCLRRQAGKKHRAGLQAR